MIMDMADARFYSLTSFFLSTTITLPPPWNLIGTNAALAADPVSIEARTANMKDSISILTQRPKQLHRGQPATAGAASSGIAARYPVGLALLFVTMLAVTSAMPVTDESQSKPSASSTTVAQWITTVATVVIGTFAAASYIHPRGPSDPSQNPQASAARDGFSRKEGGGPTCANRGACGD